MKYDWKEIARRMKAMHEQFGMAFIALDTMENALADETKVVQSPLQSRTTLRPVEMTGGGTSFALARLRGFLWNSKWEEVLARPEPVVWTAYDEEKKVIVAGLGHLVPRGTVAPKGEEILDLEEVASG